MALKIAKAEAVNAGTSLPPGNTSVRIACFCRTIRAHPVKTLETAEAQAVDTCTTFPAGGTAARVGDAGSRRGRAALAGWAGGVNVCGSGPTGATLRVRIRGRSAGGDVQRGRCRSCVGAMVSCLHVPEHRARDARRRARYLPSPQGALARWHRPRQDGRPPVPLPPLCPGPAPGPPHRHQHAAAACACWELPATSRRAGWTPPAVCAPPIAPISPTQPGEHPRPSEFWGRFVAGRLNQRQPGATGPPRQSPSGWRSAAVWRRRGFWRDRVRIYSTDTDS